MLSNKDKFYLAIDRTNWQFGKTDINILMLSAVYEGIAIRQFKISLTDQIGETFCETIWHRLHCSILGDREFIGKDWLDWLNKNGIRF